MKLSKTEEAIIEAFKAKATMRSCALAEVHFSGHDWPRGIGEAKMQRAADRGLIELSDYSIPQMNARLTVLGLQLAA